MNSLSSYEECVAQILHELGISEPQVRQRGLMLHAEATELVSVGVDIYNREQKLAPAAAKSWQALRSTASQEGVAFLLVSAFRTLDYQKQIWQRKLAAGETVETIFQVNAPPGYSEHHTGRAVDITTPGCTPLTEAFEQTAAFAWLHQRASDFGFTMSYPRNNPFGIVYEPWHWAFSEMI